jgi:hypothetical protein
MIRYADVNGLPLVVKTGAKDSSCAPCTTSDALFSLYAPFDQALGAVEFII